MAPPVGEVTQVTEVAATHLVVGAGAAGLAFTDALVEHGPPGTRVLLVDRRHGVGGHWLGAYPFVRLHQASSFYGVASTPLGGGRVQHTGPEAGLHERADQPTILAYYHQVLADRLLASGRVELLTGVEHLGGGELVSRISGRRWRVPETCRVVDARYLAPSIPAETAPPFAVADGARVVPVNALVDVEEAPSRWVVVGSGKTATDAIIWLLAHGTDPGAISWVRPREPWMLNRAVVQPDPAVFLGMAADVMASAAAARTLPEVFTRLEDAGVMLRLDPAREATMAKAPTLGTWELDALRTVEDVVRLGRVRAVEPGRLHLDGGSTEVPADTVVVTCAADGLRRPPPVPIWSPGAITVQPVRAGFPCFGAAVTGYVEATRPAGPEGDAVKNELCRPSSYGDSLADWALMQVVGSRNSARLAAEPDVAAWASTVAVNPARVPPEHPGSPALDDARERLARSTAPGIAALERMLAQPS